MGGTIASNIQLFNNRRGIKIEKNHYVFNGCFDIVWGGGGDTYQ